MTTSFFEARCAIQKFFINLEYLPIEIKINKRMKAIKKEDKKKAKAEKMAAKDQVVETVEEVVAENTDAIESGAPVIEKKKPFAKEVKLCQREMISISTSFLPRSERIRKALLTRYITKQKAE